MGEFSFVSHSTKHLRSVNTHGRSAVVPENWSPSELRAIRMWAMVRRRLSAGGRCDVYNWTSAQSATLIPHGFFARLSCSESTQSSTLATMGTGDCGSVGVLTRSFRSEPPRHWVPSVPESSSPTNPPYRDEYEHRHRTR